MTVDEILSLLETGQRVRIVWLDSKDDFREEVVFDGLVDDCECPAVWDSWEPIMISTKASTLVLVC